MRALVVAATGLVLTACAGLQFNPAPEPDALTYFEPMPFLYIAKNKDCSTTATLMMMPGIRRSVAFKSGYGTADLSVSLKDGMIASVGQKTDTKVPETITAITGAVKSLGPMVAADEVADCSRDPGKLYRIGKSGEPVEEVELPGPSPRPKR